MKIFKSLSAILLTSLLIAMMILPAMAASAPYETFDAAVAASGLKPLNANVIQDSIDGTEHFGDESFINLFDGDTATKFCSNVYPVTATWEMDAEYVLDGVIFATANDNAEYNGRNPELWTISGSNDNSSWEAVANGTEADFEETNFTYYTVSFNNDKAFKFYKFEVPSSISGTFQVSELVPCGDVPPPPVVEEVAPVEAPAEAAPVEAAPAPVVVTAPQTADFVTISAIGTLLSAGAAMLLKRTKR